MVTPEPKSASSWHAANKAPRGTELSCKDWQQEAALRMLMNSLDAEVAECSRAETNSGNAVLGAVRDWQSFEKIAHLLRALENNETLLVHAGEAVSVVPAREDAPRVIVCNEAQRPALGAEREPELAPLMAYRQMMDSSWLRIGPQEIVHSIFEIYLQAGGAHLATEHGPAGQGSEIADLSGKLIVGGGMGLIGGAQPLAATMAGAAFLGIDVDAEMIKRRLRSGYCDFMIHSLDEALRILKNSVRKRENVAVGLVGNCAEVVAELADRGVVPDILTDLTPAHEPRTGYVPNGLTLSEAFELRTRDPLSYKQRARAAIARQVEAMLRLQRMGSLVFDFGNNIRAIACDQGVADAYQIPRVVQYAHELIYGHGEALRCVALSGLHADLTAADELALTMFPQNSKLRRWIEMARQRIRMQGLPARIYDLCRRERAAFGLALNRLVAEDRIKAPVVLVADRLAFQAAPECPAPAGEEIPRQLLKEASGACVLSILKRDEVICCSQQMVVADGTEAMARRIEAVFSASSGA